MGFAYANSEVSHGHEGEQHRLQRKMLNPAFNINHMREMIPIFYEVTHKVTFPLDSDQELLKRN